MNQIARRPHPPAHPARIAALGSFLLVSLVFGVSSPAVDAASPLTRSTFSSPPLAVGGSHACALPGDGTVQCWGADTSGQLGNGQVRALANPAAWADSPPVTVISGAGSTAPLTGVVAIAAGFDHTCALLADTTVRCWGDNAAVAGGQLGPAPRSGGELGDGTTTSRSAPVRVIAGPGRSAPLTGAKALSAANGYTCALMQDGSAECWGGAPQAASLAPVAVLADSTHPLTGIVAIGAGDRHACALLATGTVDCWGADESGQLGDQGIEARSAVPVAVTVAGGPPTFALGRVSAIAVGHNIDVNENGYSVGHACAIDGTGSVQCWGANDVGELGNGGVDSSGRPFAASVDAAPGSTNPLGSVAAIAGGNLFTCAVVSGGRVTCWGAIFGGSQGGTSGPATVANLMGVVAIAAGGEACAVLADGTVECWTALSGPARVVPGVVVNAPSAMATPTPRPTRAPIPAPTTGPTPMPTSSPSSLITTDMDGLAGDWDATDGFSPTSRMITFSGGTYSVTTETPVHIGGGTCSMPSGTLIATFTGSGGSYVGRLSLWRTDTCAFAGWSAMRATLGADGRTLTLMVQNGQTLHWRRIGSIASAPPSFRGSVPTPGQVNLSPMVLAETLALAGGVIVLVPFPGGLFNSTLRANYDEITTRLRRARRRVRDVVLRPLDLLRGRLGAAPVATLLAETPGGADAARVVEDRRDFWWTPIGVGLFVFLTALLSGFLDPAFGLNEPSIATFIGMLIGLVIVLAAFDLPLAIFCRRQSIDYWLRALPATVAVSIGCVLISRLTDFHPGYLYGLVIAIVAATKFDTRTEGKLMAAGALATIVVAVVAWVGLGVVSPLASAPDPGPLLIVSQTVLSMVVVAGVQVAAFGMLPLSFMAGEAVKEWNAPVWAALLVFGWIAFGIVILNPTNGYLSDTTRTPLFTIVALLVLFSVGSVAFWYYFHRHPTIEKVTGA